jgi:hypothetical protein
MKRSVFNVEYQSYDWPFSRNFISVISKECNYETGSKGQNKICQETFSEDTNYLHGA